MRVYDEATKSCCVVLEQSIMGTAPGHSNCVFSVKWHPTDQNVLLSAGWDNTVCIWDMRVRGGAVRSIFGPHICGAPCHSPMQNATPTPRMTPCMMPPTGNSSSDHRSFANCLTQLSNRAHNLPTGDALDIDPESGTVLTGSYRPEDQLQLWDFGSGRLLQNLEWPGAGAGQPGARHCTWRAHNPRRPGPFWCSAARFITIRGDQGHLVGI